MERLLDFLERLQRFAPRSVRRKQRPSVRQIEQTWMRFAKKAQHTPDRNVGMPHALAEPPFGRMPHAACFQFAQRS